MTAIDLRSIAFPKLSDEKLEELGQCPELPRKKHSDGDVLFDAGARDFPFHVVLSGAIEILDVSGETPRRIALHERGEFTGDMAHLTGRPSIVRAVARGEVETYELARPALRQLLNICADVGDTIVQAFIARRQIVRESGTFTGFRVIGSRYSKDTFRVREFLARNRIPFTWLDVENDPDVGHILGAFGYTPADTPVVAFGRDLVFRNPSNEALADALGMRLVADEKVHDLVIVGAGPAGLAAAVYGASEGLDTLVLDRGAAGGQAGNSMRIENYFGFPTGMTGAELIERGVLQASRFGAVLSVPSAVESVSFDGPLTVLDLEGGGRILTRSLIIASGIEYRRLPLEGCARLEGCGVYYAATPNEVLAARGAEVVVVGGGNSAGQAAVYLATQASRVHLVVRDTSLTKSMSAYLADRIHATDTIEVHLGTTVERLVGETELQEVDLVARDGGRRRTIATPSLFSFIGATPRTDWLPQEIATDSRGFVLTGAAVERATERATGRAPFMLETSRRGVFAVGDVRAGSAKRVASAVGEGAMAVMFVHQVLGEA